VFAISLMQTALALVDKSLLPLTDPRDTVSQANRVVDRCRGQCDKLVIRDRLQFATLAVQLS